MKIKKLHPDAIAPQYATDGAACFDLHAVDVNRVPAAEAAVLLAHGHERDATSHVYPARAVTFRTGLAFEVPAGHVMLIFSRSGHGFKNDVRLANCVGVIDADYRGEVLVRLTNDNLMGCPFKVRTGDRIAQAMLVPIPRVEFEVVEELTSTERGAGGFGSTGA